ncbi:MULTISPECIES: hypothetical protein [unclassified Serratia (in: enterobacteria)]|uniref:hypothetical protein n=1 Tax=unclassified Serratia (in: enterobacteria) TaxID=2647522 RepID=UPI0012695CC9|nr:MULTISPECIES: hypothetical protein [unclassified Serratia (in: enterobacteria)]
MRHYFWTKSCKTPVHRKFLVECERFVNNKAVTWANILFQLFFPLSLSFTPAMASVSNLRTINGYILGANIKTVARKYGISGDGLKRINSYLTSFKLSAISTARDERNTSRQQPPPLIDNQSATSSKR